LNHRTLILLGMLPYDYILLSCLLIPVFVAGCTKLYLTLERIHVQSLV
jgi:hypothetical protein